MIDNIKIFSQSAIKINYNNMVIYFDPYKVDMEYHDANYIFITHPHYDHFSIDDILKVKKNNTKIVVTCDLKDEVNSIFDDNMIFTVKPNMEYTIDNIRFKTVPAYNIGKPFHKKEYGWVGYVLYLDHVIYVAGDTDNISDISNIKCDIAFVPVGGTYTMDYMDAANLIKIIKPNIAIPIHYKTVVGSDMDAYQFKKLLENIVDVKIIEF